ncbi:MAG TPA: PilT/PilU family type 4a pilus ATPase [Candidatus Omnitrophota bacterium]|nr:PilT/PilU family type 4a pilus ATPase [Candidatus Omnitrophota bacterium]HPS36358.1 PilT/PilU family type 4a pilus ATPase [Candidatus Omnitrophota bacterium]
MDINNYFKSCLEKMIEQKGQDIFFKVGVGPRIRVGGQLVAVEAPCLSNEQMHLLIRELITPQQMTFLEKSRNVDFGFTFKEKGCRFRGNAFYQQGFLSVVLRLLWKGIPDFDELKLPPILKKVALERSGIILVAGTVSSGKSTTVAAMVNAMNQNVSKHIVMLEDPVEFIHEDQKSLIQQREVGQDTESFSEALKYVVRQSPDAVVIGEMRDAESFSFALSAAEVGRLVISTIHAQSVTQVFDRVLGFFRRENEREAILHHFAANVTCIAVQKLLVGTDGKSLVPAVEVLLGSYIVRQLIGEKKLDKLPQALRNGAREGMQTMEQSILQLWNAKLISREVALAASPLPQELEALMKGIHIGQSTKILGE